MPPQQLGFGQLTLCRDTLQRAVKERWPSDSYDEKFRRTVVNSCLKQALVQGTKTPLVLNPLEVAKVEKDAAKADLLTEPLLDTLRGQRSSWWCRVIEKPDKPDQPQILPWLHDILKPASQEVALILAKMPQLSQPAPPPGIPPGIAPQRRPIAKSSDFTEVRSRQPKVVEDSASVPVSSEDYITRRTHAGPQETPPVDEARQVLLDALNDVWPGDDHTSVFASTAARICIQNGFILGRNVPYELNAVHAPNMGTHLHKCGIGMVRGTLQTKMALPEVKPYFKLVVYPKNTPPNIMLLLANVFNGHPSDLVNDIIQQTWMLEPGVGRPLQYSATVMSPALRTRNHQPPASDHGSEASHSSYASAAVHPTPAFEEAPMPAAQVQPEPSLPEAEARMKVLIAVSQGPACGNQDNSAAVVMRSIMFACLRDGFFANNDARFAYKLHTALVARVGAHARDTMDQLGFAGQDIGDLLEWPEFRTYFEKSTYGNTACVRPLLRQLVPNPDPVILRVLQQTEMVDAPLMAEAPRQAPAASVFDRLGPQGSLGRAESSGTSAAAQQADDDDSNAALKVKMVDTVDSVSAAMDDITSCDAVTVGCGGFEVLKTGRVSVVQVLAANICYLFDMLVTDPVAKDAVDGALKELLEDQSIMKITHDSGHLMAALQFQLSAGLHTVFDTQVAYRYMECVQALSEGPLLLNEPGLEITLEDLSDCYGVQYSDELSVTHPSEKVWNKRPLAEFMQRYSKLLCEPVRLLADQMLSELGNHGQQAILRLSKTASQRFLEPADKDPVDQNIRIKASHALGKLLPYFPVDMTQLGVKGTSALAPFPGASAASGSGEIDAVIASHHGGQVHPHPEVKDVEDWSETSSDRGGAHDMPSIKAHGTKIALPQAISYKAATARHAVP